MSFLRQVSSLISSNNISKLVKDIEIMSYYAVAAGRKIGIYGSWSDCESQVKKYSGAKFKKFDTEKEAIAYIQVHVKDYKAKSTTSRLAYLKTSSRAFLSKLSPSSGENSSDERFDNSPNFEREISKVMDRIESEVCENKTSSTCDSPQSSLKRSLADHGDDYGKKSKLDPSMFKLDDQGYVVVFTDGACSKNGSTFARAGLGVYFGEEHPLNVSEPVSGRATNNCGEIQAATKAIKIAHQQGIKKLAIMTDSQFVINSVTKWIKGWKKKGWKLASGQPVKNEIDFKDLESVMNLVDVKWIYVQAHCGILGNERADELARQGARKYKCFNKDQ